MYEDLDPDIRSLRQTVLYGLKGISAYGHQARELGYYSDEVDNFYIEALEAITDDTLTVEELIRLTMRTGEMAIAVMPVSYTHLILITIGAFSALRKRYQYL